MTMIDNATRKGDVVAMAITHSYQSLKDGRHTYTQYHLARVFKATRDGKAQKVMIGASTVPQYVAGLGQVMAITDKALNAAARRLLDNMTYPGTEWDSAEALKAAIVSERDNPAPVQFAEYREFTAADEAWSRVLQCEFGSRAGDVRYTAEGMGEPGSVLRQAHDRRERARIAWQATNRGAVQ